MHKMAFIAVAVFMIAGANITFNTQGNLNEAETRLAEDQFEILARNAAVAGLDHVKQKLADDFGTYGNVIGTNDGVSYIVNATVSGGIATVHSVSTIQDAQGDPIEFNVKAKFKQRITLPSEAPPFMRYAVISDDDLELSGNVGSEVYVDADADNELNANMHSNQNLVLNGNAALVQGFGTYKLTAQPSVVALEDNFVPAHNPTGADHVYQTPHVSIPAMIPATLASSATPDSITVGDAELTGTYDLGGTRENPYVWHVQGNLSIKNGGTTVSGYVMFLIDGEADLKANVSVGDSGYEGGDESSVAFYTGGGVRMRGNSSIWGQIYSNGGIEFEAGTPAVYGSVTTKGAVDFRGTVDIFYRKASPGLTEDFQPSLIILDRIAYSEW